MADLASDGWSVAFTSEPAAEHLPAQPERAALLSDRGVLARLEAAEWRDAQADVRDLAARVRDQSAAARDRLMDVRARAAERLALAAGDRRAAEQDREQGARERRRARADREALVLELRRERRLREQALAHQARSEKLARTLQRSLSPPVLPRIRGLDVAAHYEPFGPEEVGGDFYDLFPLGPGRAGFFLGDVCGKGPEAAAVTSLARYTMRALAMFDEGPDAILRGLNSALSRETADGMQLCTAIYGEIDTRDGSAAIALAVAGHPPPLIVRAGGVVDVTAARGTILGAVEEPSFTPCTVQLEPGDTIVLHTDGILDGEIGGVRMSEERVAELLEGAPRASAESLVERLMSAVRGCDRPLRDDVAVLALRRMPGRED